MKQEPIVWMYEVNGNSPVFSNWVPPEGAYDEGTLTPLYTAPRELSDEEIREVAKKHLGHSMGLLNWHSFARAILKKASEK